MVRHILKILQQMEQDFLSVSNHFEILCIKKLICLETVCHICYIDELFRKLAENA